ncbi:MAG: hypothetical protein E7391_06085 [Ruminococcaceae bacterium]|nr:hypothetical protein [Oscillospiraceae bacterium]
MTQTEVVDPIALGVKVIEPRENCSCCCCDCDINSVPAPICSIFDEQFVDSDDDRKVFVSLGIFTITRLERDVKLLIPVIDFCVPECECATTTDNNPCDLFEKIKFPVEEFFPPEKCNFDEINYNNGCCR